ncbi:acyltransferase family protein [Rossellomorea vietnamensis]|uniref:Acyltransferase family protein n=2 Tax=Rossellomorea TaxID=2837508 RepID=A0A5D4KCQ0_9BACI|nr:MULTISPECIES: acyltransferase family protein [Rossellomorea]TYR74530.1 acyltransferase family protein [Rossellomorea vietnamensis]TYS75092.1 acyltransferase family protein [Rossellomorea aquimaris]
MEKQQVTRRYDLDWLKVIATLLVFLYHCSMFFNPFDWHVKNNELDSSVILAFSLLIGTWIMPIFFVISGISSYFSLQKRRMGTYMNERLLRLGIPLVFGVLILSPPQVYIERLDNNQFTGSFLEFLPLAYKGLYLEIGATGNFAFVGLHLWYLLALILFSFITMHLFNKTKSFKNVTPFHLILLHIALIAVAAFVETVHLGGWDLLVYLLLFLAGYYIFSSDQLLSLLKKTFPVHLILGLTAAISYALWFMLDFPERGSMAFTLFTSLAVIGSLNVILFFYYMADRYLSFSNKLLRYTSEASLPFYILHQPVIVIIGFLIKDWSWPISLKFIFLIVVSFLIIAFIYHFVIRTLPFLRILFGLRGKKRQASLPPPAKPEVSI